MNELLSPEELAQELKRLVSQLQAEGRRDLLLRAIGVPLLEELRIEAARCKLSRLVITKDNEVLYDQKMMFHKSFGWVEPGEPILNQCSNDYVEISINQGSFCALELPELLESYDLSQYKVQVHKLSEE